MVDAGKPAKVFVGDRVPFVVRVLALRAPSARGLALRRRQARHGHARRAPLRARPGRFVAALTATDAAGRTGAAERLVTVERLTVKVLRAVRRGRKVVLTLRVSGPGVLSVREAGGPKGRVVRKLVKRASTVKVDVTLRKARKRAWSSSWPARRARKVLVRKAA